jgi:hypothetical protein
MSSIRSPREPLTADLRPITMTSMGSACRSRRGVGLVAAALLLVLVTGCTGSYDSTSGTPRSSASTDQRTGTIAGTLAVFGGALSQSACGCHREPGTVRLSGLRGTRIVVHVGRSGKVDATVPVGRYTVKAGMPGWPVGTCQYLLTTNEAGMSTRSEYVTVRPGQSTRVTVGCLAI